MTLFDGKPLTEREVAMRIECECGHLYSEHHDGVDCRECDCEEFTARKPKDGGNE